MERVKEENRHREAMTDKMLGKYTSGEEVMKVVRATADMTRGKEYQSLEWR